MQLGHDLFWLSIVSMFVPLFLIALSVGGLWRKNAGRSSGLDIYGKVLYNGSFFVDLQCKQRGLHTHNDTTAHWVDLTTAKKNVLKEKWFSSAHKGF